MSQDEVMRYSHNMKTPMFITKFKNGPYFENPNNFYQLLDLVNRTSSDCEFHELEGSHHSHLNHPENISELINEFISRHHIIDGSAKGITKDIVVPKKKMEHICSGFINTYT